MSIVTRIVRGLFARRPARPPRMQAPDVLALAHALAAREGYTWLEPAAATFDPASRTWTVCTNASSRGSNLRVVVDDEQGRVVDRTFLPR